MSAYAFRVIGGQERNVSSGRDASHGSRSQIWWIVPEVVLAVGPEHFSSDFDAEGDQTRSVAAPKMKRTVFDSSPNTCKGSKKCKGRKWNLSALESSHNHHNLARSPQNFSSGEARRAASIKAFICPDSRLFAIAKTASAKKIWYKKNACELSAEYLELLQSLRSLKKMETDKKLPCYNRRSKVIFERWLSDLPDTPDASQSWQAKKALREVSLALKLYAELLEKTKWQLPALHDAVYNKLPYASRAASAEIIHERGFFEDYKERVPAHHLYLLSILHAIKEGVQLAAKYSDPNTHTDDQKEMMLHLIKLLDGRKKNDALDSSYKEQSSVECARSLSTSSGEKYREARRSASIKAFISTDSRLFAIATTASNDELWYEKNACELSAEYLELLRSLHSLKLSEPDGHHHLKLRSRAILERWLNDLPETLNVSSSQDAKRALAEITLAMKVYARILGSSVKEMPILSFLHEFAYSNMPCASLIDHDVVNGKKSPFADYKEKVPAHHLYLLSFFVIFNEDSPELVASIVDPNTDLSDHDSIWSMITSLKE